MCECRHVRGHFEAAKNWHFCKIFKPWHHHHNQDQLINSTSLLSTKKTKPNNTTAMKLFTAALLLGAVSAVTGKVS